MIRTYEYIDSLALRRFDAIVAVSDAIAGDVRRSGIDHSKVRVIDNGIDLSQFTSRAPLELAKSTENLIIGTVGRLVSQKGINYLLRAAREVLNEVPSMKFAIVGAGPDGPMLEELAKQLGIFEKYSIHGSAVRYA